MTRHHLVLIGMMGAGKSSVGRRCAARLGYGFVDTDEIVEAVAGRTVTEIFAGDGEPTFREFERRAVDDACAAPSPTVIACGGGAVLDAANRRTLREHGTVIWLRATPGELARRVDAVAQRASRPLLEDRDAEAALERLSALREPAYAGAAHSIIDTDGLDLDAVSTAVVKCFAAQREVARGA